MQSMIPPRSIHRTNAAREARRLRRLARRQRLRWNIYVEHNKVEQARDARQEVLASLRSACVQWRLLLDIPA